MIVGAIGVCVSANGRTFIDRLRENPVGATKDTISIGIVMFLALATKYPIPLPAWVASGATKVATAITIIDVIKGFFFD